MDFQADVEGVHEDSNGFSKEQNEEIIALGKEFIVKSESFAYPIYSDLLPTLKNNILDLDLKKQAEFPSGPAAEPVQTTVLDFMHYRS